MDSAPYTAEFDAAKLTFDNYMSFEEHNYLRTAVEWTRVSERQHEAAVKNSLFIVTVRLDGKLIGMARVVGDGGYLMLLGDVVVLPQYQGHGIGRAMLERVLDYANSHCGEDEKVMICLMSVKGKEGFYEKMGFTRRPNELHGSGMSMYFSRQKSETA